MQLDLGLSDVRTVRPGRRRRLIGETGASQAFTEIGDISIRNRQLEGFYLLRHTKGLRRVSP
jgi:hypothetical protein